MGEAAVAACLQWTKSHTPAVKAADAEAQILKDDLKSSIPLVSVRKRKSQKTKHDLNVKEYIKQRIHFDCRTPC